MYNSPSTSTTFYNKLQNKILLPIFWWRINHNESDHRLTGNPLPCTPENTNPFLTGVKHCAINLIPSWPPTAPAIEYIFPNDWPSTLHTYFTYFSSYNFWNPNWLHNFWASPNTTSKSFKVGTLPSFSPNICQDLIANKMCLHSGSSHSSMGFSIFYISL